MKVFLVWEYTSEYCDMYDERNNHMDHVFETKEKAEQYLKSKGYSYKDHWHNGCTFLGHNERRRLCRDTRICRDTGIHCRMSG